MKKTPAELYAAAIEILNGDGNRVEAQALALTGILGMLGTMFVTDGDGFGGKADEDWVDGESLSWRESLGIPEETDEDDEDATDSPRVDDFWDNPSSGDRREHS